MDESGSHGVRFDSQGRPIYHTVTGAPYDGDAYRSGAPAPQLDNYLSMESLLARGVQVQNNTAQIPLDVLREVQAERVRQAASTKVPRTPRHVVKETGGGVRKGHGLWRSVSFRTLRATRERAPIIQAIHSARAYQIRRLCRKWTGKRGDVGWRVVHRDHTDWNSKPPSGFEKWITLGQRMLDRPVPGKTFSDITAGLMEDLLTINRPVVEPQYSIFDRKYLTGFDVVDGALIWPTFAFLEHWMTSHPDFVADIQRRKLTEEQALDLLSGQVGLDLAAFEYIVVREEIAEGGFRRDQLIVAPIQNRTDIQTAGYPPSHVEQAIELISAFIHTFDYNASFFTRGWMPEFMLGIKGNYNDEDVNAIVDMLREAAMGVDNAWKPPVIPMDSKGGIEKIDIKAANKEMLYEVWLSALTAICSAVYRMDPAIINAKLWNSGGGPALSEGSRLEEIRMANDDGLQGDLGHLTDHVYNPILARIHPELEIHWQWGDFDPQKEATVLETQVRQIMTRNEARLQIGMEPMGFWVPVDEVKDLPREEGLKYESNPWNQPSDPGFSMQLSQAQQLEHTPDQMDPHGFNDLGMDGYGAPGGQGGGGFGGGDDDQGGGGPAGDGFGGGASPERRQQLAKARQVQIMRARQQRAWHPTVPTSIFSIDPLSPSDPFYP